MAQWLPLTHAVELVRPRAMDEWPAHPVRHSLGGLADAVSGFWLALALTEMVH